MQEKNIDNNRFLPMASLSQRFWALAVNFYAEIKK